MRNYLALLALLGLATTLSACNNLDKGERTGTAADPRITDVEYTPAERQSIGNCWIYATASWAESMNKRATGEDFDISQSYWTYMDWFTKILKGDTDVEDGKVTISTGGLYSYAQTIIRNYGLMEESKFIPADSYGEKSSRQASALAYMNRELNEGGRLFDFDGEDRELLREVMDAAWNLDESTKTMLTEVFGQGLSNVLSYNDTSRLSGTEIIHSVSFQAYYNRKERTLYDAVRAWKRTGYSAYNSRALLKRVRKALHDREPVIISWMVDFNAFEENINSPLYGSFNQQTLLASGEIGRQGGHMTTLEDYEATIFHKETFLDESGSVARQEWYHTDGSLTLPAGAKIVLSGTGDADLYVRRGGVPTTSDYDCRPYRSDSNETCGIEESGEYFIAVSGFKQAQFTLRVQGAEKTPELVKAGVTLDPRVAEDRETLEKLLDDDTEIVFFRTKNSWGGELRPGLAYAPHSEKGYHDLYMDYLDTIFKNKQNCPNGFDSEDCGRGGRLTLSAFVLPPEHFTDGDPAPEPEPDPDPDPEPDPEPDPDPDPEPDPDPDPEPDPEPEPTGGNLITNGSFEDSLTQGWTVIDSGIELVEWADAYAGSRAAKVIVNTPEQADTDFRQTISIEAGKTYAFSVRVKNLSNSIKARLYIGGYANYSVLSNSDWQLLSTEYTATHSGQIEVGLRFYDTTGFVEGDEILIDDIQLVEN